MDPYAHKCRISRSCLPDDAATGRISGNYGSPTGGQRHVEKTVQFYRIVNEDQQPFSKAFPFEDLQDAIDDLEDDQAYVKLNRMELLGSSWKPRMGFGSQRQVSLIALDRITRNPQLRIERQRQYRPLVLGDSENLADPTFYSVFDDSVIGILRISSEAPGPQSLRDYVNHLKIIDPSIAIAPLVDRNALRTLGEVRTLTKFTVRVLPDASEDTFRNSGMIFDAIRSARRNFGGVGVEVSVKIRPTGQNEAAEEAHRQITNVVTTQALAHIDKAQITYRRLEDGKAVTHDFLNELITQSVIVEVDTETGQPAEASVSEAMATAYDALYDDIRSAFHTLE